MKYIVCGSRQFTNYATVQAFLHGVIKPDDEIIAGGQSGADSLAISYAKHHFINHTVRYARWSKYNRVAGPMRNREMLDLHPDRVIAFPPGPGGTFDMCWQAERDGVPVHRVDWEPDDYVHEEQWRRAKRGSDYVEPQVYVTQRENFDDSLEGL